MNGSLNVDLGHRAKPGFLFAACWGGRNHRQLGWSGRASWRRCTRARLMGQEGEQEKREPAQRAERVATKLGEAGSLGIDDR